MTDVNIAIDDTSIPVIENPGRSIAVPHSVRKTEYPQGRVWWR